MSSYTESSSDVRVYVIFQDFSLEGYYISYSKKFAALLRYSTHSLQKVQKYHRNAAIPKHSTKMAPVASKPITPAQRREDAVRMCLHEEFCAMGISKNVDEPPPLVPAAKKKKRDAEEMEKMEEELATALDLPRELLFDITSFITKQPDDIAVNGNTFVHVRPTHKKLLGIMKPGYWIFKGCVYVKDVYNKIRYYAGIEIGGDGYINLPDDDTYCFICIFDDKPLHPDQRLDLVGYKTDSWHPIVLMVAEKDPHSGYGRRPRRRIKQTARMSTKGRAPRNLRDKFYKPPEVVVIDEDEPKDGADTDEDWVPEAAKKEGREWLLSDDEVSLLLKWAREGTHNKQLLQVIRAAEMIKHERRGTPLSIHYLGKKTAAMAAYQASNPWNSSAW